MKTRFNAYLTECWFY